MRNDRKGCVAGSSFAFASGHRVAAAIATYIWVSSYLGSAGRGVEAPQFHELLKVEGVRAEGSSVVVTVRNIGNAKATLRAAYLMKGNVAVASETLNVELDPGQARACLSKL